ncbi:MAG: glycosyltransferase [Thermoanaerobaculaceae bacterium]|nr:glycosyltransferase [Thermoanaerobaculaceae bacterium]
MKILLVNKFLFLNGGSEACLFDTGRWLKERGHHVVYLGMADRRNAPLADPTYLVSHVDLETASWREQARVAGRILWSLEAQRVLERAIAEHAPDIAHLHNVYHQISPSILHVLRRAAIPAVMTLHDYKLVCPVYTLYRAGGPCERCRGGRYTNCVLYRCCKGSFGKSFLAAVEMFLHHRVLKVYRSVSRFIAPSRFLAAKVAQLGFLGPICYLPNAVDVAALPAPATTPGDGVVYFGRLTEEKGVLTVLDAVAGLNVPCTIVGDGPFAARLRAVAAQRRLTHVRFLGQLGFQETLRHVARAAVVVVPSLWYENAPRNVLEAFALARPVIASRIGGLPELVRDGVTGLTFAPGNSDDLRRAMLVLLENPQVAVAMGLAGRRLVEAEYSAASYTGGLLAIYEDALGRH